MRIDAHQHFWRPARGDYGWLTQRDHPLICRDALPENLRPHLNAARIDRTILVQAAPTVAETKFLLGLAAQFDWVGGVVGWVDLGAADAPQQVLQLSADAKLRGLRPMLQDLEDDDWILRPELSPGLNAMVQAELRFDALVKPRHLPVLLRLVERFPDLPIVIDHAAKPAIAAAGLSIWRDAIGRLARETAAVCKLSGLVTEAGADWRVEHLAPYLDVLLTAFGPKRLMWGSDWPVVDEAGGYAKWFSAAEALTGHLSVEDFDWIFGRTAADFYGLPA